MTTFSPLGILQPESDEVQTRLGQYLDGFNRGLATANQHNVRRVILLKVDEKISTPFDTVKANLDKTIRQKKVHDMLDAMKTAAKPTFNDAYFATPPAAPAAAAEKKQ